VDRQPPRDVRELKLFKTGPTRYRQKASTIPMNKQSSSSSDEQSNAYLKILCVIMRYMNLNRKNCFKPTLLTRGPGKSKTESLRLLEAAGSLKTCLGQVCLV
jgi:hypothetical protein